MFAAEVGRATNYRKTVLELAAMTRDAIAKGQKKDPNIMWAKLKFDRQIVAIAKVAGATAIYSDDTDIRVSERASPRKFSKDAKSGSDGRI